MRELPQLFKERMQELLKEEYPLFLSSYENNPSKAFQINHRYFSNNEFSKIFSYQIEPISYTTNGFLLKEEVKIGNLVLHQIGAFYVQEPSAMMVVNSVPIKESDVVLDLCAAPGGKSIAIANQLKGTGILFSNEINPSRNHILLSNLERMGIGNTVVGSLPIAKIGQLYPNFFDVVFLDTPCSGEGMFRKNPEAMKEWSIQNVLLCANRSKELLKEASKTVKQGGYLVYSTCTFNQEENEDVIARFLKEQPFELVEVPEKIKNVTAPGTGMPKCRRFYPHLAKGEGQFVAVLKKVGLDETVLSLSCSMQELTRKENEIVMHFLHENLVSIPFQIRKYHDNIIATMTPNLPIPNYKINACFVKIGDIVKDRFIPHHQFVKAYGSFFQNQLHLPISDKRIISYLKGEEIVAETVFDGFGVLFMGDIPVGLFKAKNHILKNHYPKGLRINY